MSEQTDEQTPVQIKGIKQMQGEVHEVNVQNGWFDGGPRSFGDDIALLHTEVSEAFEAYRDHQFVDATKSIEDSVRRLAVTEAPTADQFATRGGLIDPASLMAAAKGEGPMEPVEASPLPKPEGVGSELADVLIRLLDTCQRYGIDLEGEYERKLAYNRTRGFKHGGKVI